jgi:hypothetical protein
MLRRILALVIALAAMATPGMLLGVLYLRERSAPPKTDYYPICSDQYTDPPCASLETLFTAGAALRMAGAALSMLAVLLAALLLLRLARWPRLALVTAIVTATSGAYAFWLSQQALRAFRDLSLLPDSYPPDFFRSFAARADTVTRLYLIECILTAAFLGVALAITFAQLWDAANPRGTIELEAGDARRFSVRGALALGAFAAVLLAPALALGMVFELERPEPCQQRYDPACFSLDAMVAAGAIIRGAGIVLVGLAITLVCALLQRLQSRLPIALGMAGVAFATGLWLISFSQRVLDDYFPAPWNAETYPPGALDGRVGVVAYLAQTYTLWGLGAVALASVTALVGLMILRGGNDRAPHISPPVVAM